MFNIPHIYQDRIPDAESGDGFSAELNFMHQAQKENKAFSKSKEPTQQQKWLAMSGVDDKALLRELLPYMKETVQQVKKVQDDIGDISFWQHNTEKAERKRRYKSTFRKQKNDLATLEKSLEILNKEKKGTFAEAIESLNSSAKWYLDAAMNYASTPWQRAEPLERHSWKKSSIDTLKKAQEIIHHIINNPNASPMST